jgi:C4-dicarboxylate-specific signal transduction histidine kinase
LPPNGSAQMDTSASSGIRVRSLFYGYGLAILAVASALVITRSLQPTVFPTPLFFAAIVISTWFGGTGPGLTAIILATLLLNFYFVSPVRGFTIHTADLPYMVQFVLPALLSGWFTKKRKDAETALKEARDHLDAKVQERTAQLRHSNQQLESEITERKRAEDAVHKTQADLAHLTRVMTMSELATSIAHEVNQPLAAIVTNGAAGMRWLAAEPPNVERARDSITRIISEGDRASEVIKRIRTLSKKASPHKSSLGINEVIHDVLALIGTELVGNRIIVTCELKPDVPPVTGDRVQLQQVLLNLIMNGIEAMADVPSGSRKLFIQSNIDDRGKVLVCVRDSGTGVDPRCLEQVFEAFYTTKAEGVGMGLSISRSIVEAHGGRLWASCNNGPGASFQFTLPTGEEA